MKKEISLNPVSKTDLVRISELNLIPKTDLVRISD